MSRPEAKGWCPGAYRPMMSGDGLVVRVRPVLARLTATQMLGLCDLAEQFGSGLIDLTSRANLQIRGVKEGDHEPLLQSLAALQLLESDPDLEGRRNILMAPLWQDGDDGHAIALDLMARLSELPPLPAKMGFAIDAGAAPALQGNSADFRIERSTDGTLILRADGTPTGRSVSRANAVDAILNMARWFVDTGGAANRRMATHLGKAVLPAEWTGIAPAPAGEALALGPSVHGTLCGTVHGAAFGQIEAKAMRTLIENTRATGLRVTPWRLFLLENAAPATASGFITVAADPLLQINACPGAPFCTAATVDTRILARDLAKSITGPLHVSGCAKGCASPRKCRTTLVGRGGKFDLVRNGLPWDEPLLTDLSPDTLIDRIGDD